MSEVPYVYSFPTTIHNRGGSVSAGASGSGTGGSGSNMSRRRVGSVSQRGGEGLTPLDIQSIQMPSNPQNALALKTAALSSRRSLFQTCSMLRKRLRNVEDFPIFLQQRPDVEQLDVVSHMCHILRLGSPLCHLYNLLIPAFVQPGSPVYQDLPLPMQIEYDLPEYMSSPGGIRNYAKLPEHSKTCQRYIAQFTMAMKQRSVEGRWHGEMWALHELWGKSRGDDEELQSYDSTGLMKVLHTVEEMLDSLPSSAIRTSPDSPQTPYTAHNPHQGSISYDVPFSMGGTGPGSNAVANMAATMNGGVHTAVEDNGVGAEEMARSRSAADANAFKTVEELVKSEQSYVQELEILVRCSVEMVEKQLVSTETSHKMFSNLSKILDFHRKFLIKLETEYEPVLEGNGQRAWAEGRWGRPFVASEPDFDCYGPYCANYLEAITIVNAQMPNLMRGEDLPESERPCLHPERELQAFMIKPIQRITKYGLLLDAILKATQKHDYPYRSELEEGAAAVRRIAARINEVTDFKAKQATVRELLDRVEDWKGHEVEKFGDLWLDDHFTVEKQDQPREYHVFLFEKMMLCCKEVTPERKSKSGKNASMLRKDKSLSKSIIPEKKRLALKGRIFLSNIYRASVLPAQPGDASPYRMIIAWSVPHRQANGWSDDSDDSFIMVGKSDDQIKKWCDKVMKLATAERKKQEEIRAERARLQGRYSNQPTPYSSQSMWAPPTPAAEQPPYEFPPPVPSWENHDDEDEGFRSGRTTPSLAGSTTTHGTTYGPPSQSGRRVQSQQSMPADRQAELRARALTEDQFGPSITQWRSQQGPSAPMPPPLPRLTSAMSAMSTASEASFGNPRPALGRHVSGARLDISEEVEDEGIGGGGERTESAPGYMRGVPRGMTRAPSTGVQPSIPYPASALRNRSASSPNVYQQPKISIPPIPGDRDPQWSVDPTFSPPSHPMTTTSSATLVGGTAYFTKRMSGERGKRSSGESHSTETSETSSGQSPATPYSSVPDQRLSSLRQNSSDTVGSVNGPNVLIKLRWGEHQFGINVPFDINFATMYQKISKKIRLSRGTPMPETIQIKWIDADNDEVSLRCDADIEAMFDEVRELGLSHVNLVAR